MKKFWALFFIFWPIVALYVCWIAPSRGWWFPSKAMSSVGHQIDGLFYLILYIVTFTFIATQAVMGYALWKGATKKPGDKALFSHGSHKLEIVWTIVPSFILVFISLTQLEVLANIRVISKFPDEARRAPPPQAREHPAVSELERDEAKAREELAIAAALRVVEQDGPLAGHPAYRSAWRRQAAREQLDNGMDT